MHHAAGEIFGIFAGDLLFSPNDGTNRLLPFIRGPWLRNAFHRPRHTHYQNNRFGPRDSLHRSKCSSDIHYPATLAFGTPAEGKRALGRKQWHTQSGPPQK